MKKIVIYLFASSFILISACGGDSLKINVSDVYISEVKINRLEQDLIKLDTTDVLKSTEVLKTKYGAFYTRFVTTLINNGGIRDSSYAFRIKQFISDKDMKMAFDDCQKIFPNTDALTEQFTSLFKHFAYYFPEKKLPKIATIMSGFNYNVVYLDSTLAIGLEMYLGSSNSFYQMMAFPHYKSAYMNPENIMPDVTRIWMLEEFPYTMNKSDFLSQITYMGKIMYLTDAFLPETADSLKMQYSTLQLEYCTQNEFNVWSYFAAQKLLYTTDQSEIMKYTSDGPFTSALSKESAPRIGYWIGWQIVRQYMKNNPDITLPELMAETDAQVILKKAKYKPRK